MKYLKYFENNTNKTFWLVRTKMPYFEIALKKLNMTKAFITLFINSEHIKKSKISKIFIPIGVGNKSTYYNASNKEYNYNTNETTKKDFFKESKEDLESQGFKYMGEVKISKQDLLDWEMENKAKKYNL